MSLTKLTMFIQLLVTLAFYIVTPKSGSMRFTSLLDRP